MLGLILLYIVNLTATAAGTYLLVYLPFKFICTFYLKPYIEPIIKNSISTKFNHNIKNVPNVDEFVAWYITTLSWPLAFVYMFIFLPLKYLFNKVLNLPSIIKKYFYKYIL